MKEVTLCYLLQEGLNGLEVCLARKKRKHVAGWWNAAGGGLEGDEKPAEAAARELLEEQGVKVEPSGLKPLAVIDFCFPQDLDRKNLRCYVFMTHKWAGEPRETEEMGSPKWFAIGDLPIDELPPADRYWLPAALRDMGGEVLVKTFELNEDYSVASPPII